MTRLADVSTLDIAAILDAMKFDGVFVTEASACAYVATRFPQASFQTRGAIATRVLRLYAEQVFKAARAARRF